jgi:hypothetical protein
MAPGTKNQKVAGQRRSKKCEQVAQNSTAKIEVRSSLVQKIAEWIHARDDGAVSADVVEAFNMTTVEASNFMNEIKRGERFITRIKYYNGNRLGRRLYVDEIKPLQDGRAMPVVGVNEAAKQVVRFPSIGQAESVGGFDTGAICRCLKGSQQTHAGYRWSLESTEPVTTPMEG